MNIKRMLMLASMALAAIAFAVPAGASAAEFTHEGEPAEEVEAGLTGPAGFTLNVAPTEGVHCEKLDVTLLVWANFGLIKKIEFTGCTTTSADPNANGLSTHAELISSGDVHPLANGQIEITDVHINNKVTHPEAPVVISESTLTGDMLADAGGPTESIETVTLSSNNALAEIGLPPEPPALEASVTGHLTGDGTIGIEN